MRLDRRTSFFVLAAACLCGSARAQEGETYGLRKPVLLRQTVWFVDDDAAPGGGSGRRNDPFHAIQQGVDAALDGEVVLVAPGIYRELVDFSGKAIRVVASEGPAQTFIQSAVAFGPGGVRFVSGEGHDSVLEGFTVRLADGIQVEDSAPTILRNVIASNAYVGILCRNAPGVRILSNVIRDNAEIGITGSGSELLISGNVILSHFVEVYPHAGGGIYLFESSATLVSNVIAENVCGNLSSVFSNTGAGVYALDSVVFVRQCTFTRNQAWTSSAPGTGGAIAVWNSELRVSGSIFWDDAADDGAEIWASGSFVRVDHSDVEGGQPGIFSQGGTLLWGDGNLEQTPLFRNPSSDYRLMSTSPLIDKGQPALTPGGVDAWGDPRILDGDGNGVQRVDIGADERDDTELLASGTSVLGGTLTLTTVAPAGRTYELFVASEPGDVAVPPFGSMLIGNAGLQTVGAGAVPGVDAFAVPNLVSLLGSELWFQSLSLDAALSIGSFSNAQRFVVH